MLRHSTLTIGDRAMFPLDRLGSETVYRQTWAIVAFTLAGAVVARRRHDGLEKIVSAYWWRQYAIDAPLTTARPALGPLPWPQIIDRAPGFYTSARLGRAHRLLFGPFDSEADARRLVTLARVEYARRHGSGRESMQIAFGTARSHSCARAGVWNDVLTANLRRSAVLPSMTSR